MRHFLESGWFVLNAHTLFLNSSDMWLYFIPDAGIDQAVALLMALEENEVEVVPGVEGNLTEFRDLGQKAEQEGMPYQIFIAL